jgi:DNA-binding transcriptional regulator YdaS (Cro superfamily)
MEPQIAFKAVIEKVGSQNKLGDLIKRSQSTISHWAKSGIPAEAAIEIERATDGKIPRWMCRPDLWEHPQ